MVTKEIERVGIPVAILTAIPLIPMAVGSNRVVKGIRVEHVCGNPLLSKDDDLRLQKRIVQTALGALQTSVDKPTLFEPDKAVSDKEVVNA